MIRDPWLKSNRLELRLLLVQDGGGQKGRDFAQGPWPAGARFRARLASWPWPVGRRRCFVIGRSVLCLDAQFCGWLNCVLVVFRAARDLLCLDAQLCAWTQSFVLG